MASRYESLVGRVRLPRSSLRTFGSVQSQPTGSPVTSFKGVTTGTGPWFSQKGRTSLLRPVGPFDRDFFPLISPISLGITHFIYFRNGEVNVGPTRRVRVGVGRNESSDH